MKAPLRILFAAAGALLLSGCAGYRLGSTNGAAAGTRSIQLTPFANRTLEPRLSDAVTSAMRKTLQRDGTYRLDTGGDADVVVAGVLTKYYRSEMSFLPNDVATARDYRIFLTAHVTARERATGKLILDKPFTGSTLIRIGSDLTSTERQALPLLAADLAKKVAESLVDSSW